MPIEVSVAGLAMPRASVAEPAVPIEVSEASCESPTPTCSLARPAPDASSGSAVPIEVSVAGLVMSRASVAEPTVPVEVPETSLRARGAPSRPAVLMPTTSTPPRPAVRCRLIDFVVEPAVPIDVSVAEPAVSIEVSMAGPAMPRASTVEPAVPIKVSVAGPAVPIEVSVAGPAMPRVSVAEPAVPIEVSEAGPAMPRVARS